MISIEIPRGKSSHFVDFDTYEEAQTWLLLGSFLGDKGQVFVHVVEPLKTTPMLKLMIEAEAFIARGE